MVFRPARALGFLACVAVLASCGDTPVDHSEPILRVACPLCIVDTKPHPEAEIAALIDLGEVPVGHDVTSKITIVNVGTISVEVVEIRDDLSPFATDLACGSKCGTRTIPM